MKYYAGIGSRKTPITLQDTIKRIVNKLEQQHYILRSGAADGADLMFENEIISKDNKEIFLPWKGYNGSDSLLYLDNPEAWPIAEQYHPNWNGLSEGAKKMMVRNCFQVLGFNLKTPVDFIVCWTKDGKASGGTGQALRMAKDLEIPIFNLYFEDAEEKLYRHLYLINNSLF